MFNNRNDAGRQLAEALKKYKNQPQTVVLAIPRGGVVIGYEIADELNLPLDIVVTKKIGAPNNPEFAIGSVNMDGEVMIDREIVDSYGISQNYLDKETEKLKGAIKDKLRRLRGSAETPDFKDKTVILTDDGIATGYTMKAAISYLKHQKAAKLIVAIPVGPPETIKELKKSVDEVVCLQTPAFFGAVGNFYKDFTQVEDEAAKEYLTKIKTKGLET